MKSLFKIFAFFVFANLAFAQTLDSMKVLEYYSLFSEYHKNKDYESALPYGWDVIKANPSKFAKWIYFKMEDCLWYLRDSSNVSPELKQAIDDSIYNFYETAKKYRPEDLGYWEARQAFVSEVWLNKPADEVIKEYEEAINVKPDLSSFYYDRLGQLYKNNATEENGYKMKAIDIYRTLRDREPDVALWDDRLKELVENIDELLAIVKNAWEQDKENVKKAAEYYQIAVQASSFKDAIPPLEFLVTQTPDNPAYWNQLAQAYHKTDKLSNAEDAYRTLIKLEPDKQEHYLNLGIIYQDMGKFAAARSEYLKASEVGNGWGLPIYYEGYLYEQTARGCEFNFETKLVYLLAVNTYRKAYSMDQTLSQAKERITALSNSVPTQEDYFFRGYKSGDVIPITNACGGWTGKSVTVP